VATHGYHAENPRHFYTTVNSPIFDAYCNASLIFYCLTHFL
jgi:hypothetical protein